MKRIVWTIRYTAHIPKIQNRLPAAINLVESSAKKAADQNFLFNFGHLEIPLCFIFRVTVSSIHASHLLKLNYRTVQVRRKLCVTMMMPVVLQG